MLNIFLIALGGALGAVSRYAVSLAVHACLGRSFPYGTLVVNVSGCFIIGVLSVFLLERMLHSTEWRAFAMIGFLGAFTTFSSFSLETLNFYEQGAYFLALINIFSNVAMCLLAVTVGVMVARLV